MKKKEVHYILITKSNEVIKTNNIKDTTEVNPKLIIKRTFIKTSKGGSHKYFSNEIITNKLEKSQNNSFNWGYIKCKIINDERWYPFYNENVKYAIVLDIEVIDCFNRSEVYQFRMESKNIFKKIINKLNSINKYGSHIASNEIEKQIIRIENLEMKNLEIESSLNKIQKLLFEE